MFYLLLGIVSDSNLIAQVSFSELENKKVMFPSPTAASLGKYGEYPVSLYNGLVNIGQEIVTVKSGRLALNVTLSYHASGNKPSDIPGWVGLGFSLNAGGVITRITRDIADDNVYGFYSNNEALKYWWNNSPNTHLVEGYFSGNLDPRSDVYQFNFCGYTGEFVFDWDRNIHFKQKVPFDIQILGGGAGGFGGFEITTEDGTVYRFDQAEHSSVSLADPNPPISSWYLTKITNLSGDIISLKYSAPLSKFRYKQYSTRKEVVGSVIGGGELASPTISLWTSKDEVIYLDEIEFNNGELQFQRSKRMDPYFIPDGITSSSAEEQKLDLIVLKDNSSNIIKQWKFEYYENSSERLKLKNLIVQGSDQVDVQRYSFSYNNLKLPLPLPGPNSSNPYLANDVDYWGYWNGATNGENRIPKMYLSEFNQWVGSANRSVNPIFVKAEMLEKITYPTGGYTLFEFESNDYSEQGASFAIEQNPMFESSTPPEAYELHYDRDDGGFDVDPTSVSFTLTAPTHVYIRYSCSADGPNHSWGEPGRVYEADLQLSAGTHNFAGIFATGELLLPYNADINKAHCFATVYKIGPLVPIPAKKGPGLRIKSITTNDGISTSTRSFEYKLDNDPNSNLSSGFLGIFPAFYAPLQSFASNLLGYCVTSEPINDIGEDAPVGYRRVVERFEDNSYIEHYYRAYDSYPDEFMPFTNGYSNPKLAHMSSNRFQRGQETRTVYYNSNGQVQTDITYDYAVLPESVTSVQCIELKPTVGVQLYVDGPVNMVNGTLTSLYYVQSCFFYNNSRTEVTYDANSQNPITTIEYIAYDNTSHLQPTRVTTVGSDGSTITKATSFPDDFASGVPFIDYMQANHLKSFPIEQVVYKQREGVTKIISGNIITYKAEGSGLPSQLLKLENAGPISLANFKFSNRIVGVLPASSSPTPYSADTRYQLVSTYTQYDNKGNLLESIGRNGVKTTYLWGYNQEYPVAQVVGSDHVTVSGKINNPSILNNPSSDESLRTELNNLRTINGGLVKNCTYAPLIGITSETDPVGRTTYYEYDLFSRLSVVRDQDNNILKKYCYNYAGQPEYCHVYKSEAISNDYYSQNCSPGQTPVAYHVTVPAGKFSSSVDQETANQMAQQYAQNLANQYGTCEIQNVSLYYENQRGGVMTIQFHNASSEQSYYFTVYGHEGGELGEVPPGVYDIIINGGSYFYAEVGCGYYTEGTSQLTFYSIPITSSCNFVSIY